MCLQVPSQHLDALWVLAGHLTQELETPLAGCRVLAFWRHSLSLLDELAASLLVEEAVMDKEVE